MKNSFRVSRLAAADLDDIWLHIAQDNPDAADNLMARFTSRFSKLVSIPDLGRLRNELSPDLRGLPVGRYVIFYRQTENNIEIVRVLHGARDFPPLFE